MKYQIHCPKCGERFYVSKKLNNWEKEFVKEIDNLVKQMKKKAKKNEKSN